jgi:hypothetical protein
MALGANAMFFNNFGTPVRVSLTLPLQFAVPVAVGWWFARRRRIHRYAATALLVFAISPLASYTLLSLLIGLTARAVLIWSSVSVFFTLMAVAPTVVASGLVYHRFAKRLGSRRKWMFVSCLALTTFLAIPFMPLLLVFVVPMAITSLLYCRLARWAGIGWQWMLVACTVLAVYAAATRSPQGGHWFAYYDGVGQHHVVAVLWMCITLAQVLVPLAIGWWFLRRKHDPGQLQPVP